MLRRLTRIALLAIPTLIVAALIAYMTLPDNRQSAESGPPPVASSSEIGGPFSLVDHTGQPVTEADWAGEHMLIFFGFTYCPDFCPAELSTIAEVMDLLGDDAAELNPIFVTIDPDRDTPEALADYVDLFHPRMTGLTGTHEQINAIASEYRVFYQKVDSDRFEDYTMDHSTFTYLMGPDGENRGIFAHGMSAEEMAAAIRSLMKETIG